MENKFNPHLKKQGTPLTELVNLLVGRFSPLAIYQFGLRHKLAAHQSVFSASERVHTPHYYLLMIIASETKKENGVNDCVKQNFTAGTATLLVHGWASVTDALMNEDEFFSTVIGQGQMVYSDGSLPALTCPVKGKFKQDLAALKNFAAHKNAMALGYVNAAGACLETAQYAVCVCLLYQAIEQAAVALLRVFLGYTPQTYRLGHLLNLICCFNVALGQTFTANPDTEQLFNLLCQSYAKGRYSDSLSITATTATTLQEIVWNFVRLTKQCCASKLKADETIG